MSISRYRDAGPVGTGTTINNMASRTKVWINIAQTPVTPLVRGSFNVSAYLDISVGYGSVWNINPFFDAAFTALAAGWAQANWANRETAAKPYSASEMYVYSFEGVAPGAPTDTEQLSAAAIGNLA